MLCQLCSGLDLAAIMQMRLGRDFGWSPLVKEDFFPQKVTDWSDFEESEHISYFIASSAGRDPYEHEKSFVPYHKTLDDFYQASEACDLCQALLQSAAAIIKIRKELNSYSCWRNPSGKGLFLCGLSKGQGIQLMAWVPSNRYARLGGVGFCVDNGSALASVIRGRTIPKSPMSKDSLKSIKKWLSTCSIEHEHCINYAFKPSRLVQYDQSKGKVTLCTSFPSNIKYAALSHCWGSVQPLTLKTSTKEHFEKGLPIQLFPKTFQDAFWMIQQLDIPYIWIDSLCIVQDDNDDWVHESARMCDVYGNAHLTIAATRAQNCSEGFLGLREASGYIYVPLKMDGVYANVATFAMPLRCLHPWSDLIELEEEPLSKRAWALQERYLSPKTLHFASTQLYFECGSEFYPQDRHLKHKESRWEFEIHGTMTENDNTSLTDLWNVIVRRYTRRYLTVGSDKLPAVGGLAARLFFQRSLEDRSGDEYLAGLWRKSLLSDLAWRILQRDAERSNPTYYTAPSWSWASINQAVTFLDLTEDESFSVIKGAKVHLESSESPFGNVTGGWVHLSSIKLCPCEVDSKGGLFFREGSTEFHVNPDMDSSRFDLPQVHLADYKNKPSELFAAPLTFCFEPESVQDHDNLIPGAVFLILISSTSGQKPIDGVPCFRRVGLGFTYGQKWYRNNPDAKKAFRKRCLEAKGQGILDDFIIV